MRRTPSLFEATKAGGDWPRARGVTSRAGRTADRGCRLIGRGIPAMRRHAPGRACRRARGAGDRQFGLSQPRRHSPNPAADAKLMSDTLLSLGFFVVGGGARLDLDKKGFDEALTEFGKRPDRCRRRAVLLRRPWRRDPRAELSRPGRCKPRRRGTTLFDADDRPCRSRQDRHRGGRACLRRRHESAIPT